MGPVYRIAESSDIPEIVELQAQVWHDHFIKERNMQLPIMRRTVQNMNYYFKKEPEGCIAALVDNKIIGTVISHVWGSVGWFGPLEVDPRYQGKGIGQALVKKSLEYLQLRECTTIGCETMAGSSRNLAFYHKLGFRSKALSHVLFKVLGEVLPEAGNTFGEKLYQSSESLDDYKKMWSEILPGLDYSVEFESVAAENLGEIWVADSEAGPAHAIVHTHDMFEDSQNAILKLLVARDMDSADKLLKRCEVVARVAGKTGMFIRSYSTTPPDLGWFFVNGYTLQGASVRLLRQGEDESGDIIHVSCWSG